MDMTPAESEEKKQQDVPDYGETGPDIAVGEFLNVSGHPQELDRNFGFWSICGISIVADDAWAAGAGSLVTSLYDGGPPGVLYEFVVVSIFYFFIGAALAELASAIPSSAAVYHWASVTPGPRWGRVCSFYAGWWNMFAWTFGTAFASLAGANAAIGIYSLYHPNYSPERWQIFIAFLGVTVRKLEWIACCIVMFGQHQIARLANSFAFVCMAIWFISLMVCATMPATTNEGYASHEFIWKQWNNQTGYSSNGLVFCIGMLNGAFAIGTPDGCSHLAEEVPDPKRNIPKGIAAQLTIGFITTWAFYIAVLYAITDIDAIFDSPIVAFPLAAMYQQATRSNAGTAALLILFIINQIATIPGAYITAGRMLWTVARDDGTPFSAWVSHVSRKFRNPLNATLCVGIMCTILGCVYIGNATAFNAFVGVFTILTTMSYLAAILPHILTRRKYVKPGPFWMPGVWGYLVHGVASAYIIVFNIIYFFPYALPVSAQNMNYSVLMSGGLTIIVGIYYLWKRNHGYEGPHVHMEIEGEVMVGSVSEMAARQASVGSGRLKVG